MTRRKKTYPLENQRNDDESVAAEVRLERASGIMRPTSPIEAMMMGVEWDERNDLGGKAIDLFQEILSDRERWVLYNLIYERRSVREVAAMMSLSPPAVHRIKTLALNKLREALDENVRDGSDER